MKERDVKKIGIVMGEIIKNEIKNDFKGRKKGSIRVSIKKDMENVKVMIVEDEGVGWKRKEGDEKRVKGRVKGIGMIVVEKI